MSLTISLLAGRQSTGPYRPSQVLPPSTASDCRNTTGFFIRFAALASLGAELGLAVADAMKTATKFRRA